ncbi:hypothetical protein BGZ46_004207 [Entomortierella lignicola]|nr:hypothetical protein BGZ46_004207 [Entomortierella lignicola]
MTPLPKGPLTTDDRLRLQRELEQIKKTTNESQAAYKAAHASIPAFQQLVLTTHAQVAAAKQAVLQAKGITSSALSSNSSSNSSSCSTSPPSPSSPLENQSDSEGVQYLRKLEQEHVDLGIKLSQVLRDKAEAEETKKRLNDYIIRAKSRIKEIERKLLE